jgi:hypothetical protein
LASKSSGQTSHPTSPRQKTKFNLNWNLNFHNVQQETEKEKKIKKFQFSIDEVLRFLKLSSNEKYLIGMSILLFFDTFAVFDECITVLKKNVMCIS